MPEPVRVALCDAYPHQLAGAQRVLLDTIEAASTRVSTSVVLPAVGRLGHETARFAPTTVVPASGVLADFGGILGARAAAALPRYWLSSRHAFRHVDVAHLSDHRAMLMYGPAARAAGARVVWHVHLLSAPPAIDRVCARLADAIVVPSDDVGLEVSRRTGVTAQVIPGRVPAPTARWAPGGDLRLATIARIAPSKGLDTMLHALADLRRTHDVTWDLIGAGRTSQDADELLALATRLGVADAVRQHGEVDDPWPIVTEATAYVQPSRNETQGLAVRTALLAGMPVVATDLGAFADVLTDERTALIVPVDEPTALARALRRLLDDPTLQASLSRQAAATDVAAWSTAALEDLWARLAVDARPGRG